MFGYQCTVCGANTSAWIKRSEVTNPAAVPAWDESLRDEFWKNQRTQRLHEVTEQRRSDIDAWRREHSAYLLTPQWRSLRARVLIRAGGLCEGCRTADATCVHHLTYDHWKDELLFELVALCNECHDKAHGRTGVPA